MGANYMPGIPAISDSRDSKAVTGSTVDGVVAIQNTVKAVGEDANGAFKDLVETVVYINTTPSTTNLPNVKVPARAYDYVAGKAYVAVGTLGELPASWAAQA